jgi:two-component system LytT family sensor kinase
VRALREQQIDCLVVGHLPDIAPSTLAEELHNIDRYLRLERARFGDSLKIKLQVAPEVLNVVVPFLALQPLVENAVRHGLAGRGGGSIEIVARDAGTDCAITVEDDGVGMDPELLRSGPADALADSGSGHQSAHVGLTNVDHRLRAAFGDDYGLVVETAIGAGTKVLMRVPKFRLECGPAEVPWHERPARSGAIAHE